MLKLPAKNRSRAVVLLLLLLGISAFYGFHSVSNWQEGLTLSNDASTSLGAFVEASDWLSKNLGQDETALVPMRDVFDALNPQLRDKLVDYKSLWESSRVILRANTTQEEVLKVRRYFIHFLKKDMLIKYVVRDWVDQYARHLFEAEANDELIFLLREVRTFPFTLSTGWSSKVTIYERMQYTTLFAMRLASPPSRYSTIPSNVSVQYSWSGVTIQKSARDQLVGFYLPLEAGINASKQNYFTMQFKLDVENVQLQVVFYYDKNRDGRFSGYEIDYVNSARFNQTKQGWLKGTWYQIFQDIPEANDPIVMIGIIMAGNEEGAITITNLIVYTEITPDIVSIEASKWLSENLNGDEFALVPSPALFYMAQPDLRFKLVDYISLWASAEVFPYANITNEELVKVRSYLVDFIKGNASVRYVVRDWVDPDAELLFGAMVNDDLMFLLREVKSTFLALGKEWSRKITIYETVQYTNLLTMNFSSPPRQYYTIPSNASILFDSNGASIQKVGPSVGFYLPLEAGINASKQNYFTMQFKLDVENVQLQVVFYYDKNRDGRFSGYEIDYVNSARFNQTKQGWLKGTWYQIFQDIPEANDPIVLIAVSILGDNDGTITLAYFAVDGEVASRG